LPGGTPNVFMARVRCADIRPLTFTADEHHALDAWLKLDEENGNRFAARIPL